MNIVDVFIFEAQQMLKDLLERIFDSDGSKCIVVFNAYNFIYYNIIFFLYLKTVPTGDTSLGVCLLLKVQVRSPVVVCTYL